jgi:hypothetical protein
MHAEERVHGELGTERKVDVWHAGLTSVGVELNAVGTIAHACRAVTMG